MERKTPLNVIVDNEDCPSVQYDKDLGPTEKDPNIWSESTVEKQVLQGIHLREAKPRIYGDQRSLQLVRPLSGCPHTKKTPYRICQVRPNTAKSQINRCCSPVSPVRHSVIARSTPPASRPTYSVKKDSSRPTTPSIGRQTKAKKCPLRIAELAEPTKRHCIETWKSNGSTLPAYMLDRLRKQIMGQKILATVPDAIDCFSRIPKSQNSRKKGQGRLTKMKQTEDFLQMRSLCALFAHCMAQKLIKPVNISLTEELEQLSRTITGEMMNLFGNKNRLCPDYLFDPKILAEMSGKITYWIAGILDDAYYKILEDEVRAKKRHENIEGKEGQLVTLIEKYILMQFEDRGNLEEEEGPALDVLDTVIENVVKLCIPQTDSDDESPDRGGPDGDRSPIPETEGESENGESAVGESDTDGKRDEDENTSTEKLAEDDRDQLLSSKPTLYQIPKNFMNQIDNADIANNPDSDSNYDNAVKLEGTEAQIRDMLNAILTEANLNVSEVFVVVSEDQSDGDDKKTVKFTEMNTESSPIQSAFQSLNSSNHSITRSLSGRQEKLDNAAPPIPRFLSFAYEPWPNNFIPPMLKASQSVSRSVISLGKIPEFEETGSSRDHSKNFDIIKSEYDKIPIDTSLEKSPEMNRAELKEDDDQSPDFSDATNLFIVKDKPSDEPSSKDGGDKGDHYDTDNEKNFILEAIKQKLKQSTKNKFDYKVHPKTAPTWVLHCSSEESNFGVSQSKKELTQCELQKWCKDLEHTLGNLEQWNDWIDITCRKILALKQQTEVNTIISAIDKSKQIKVWAKLKKNIDKDAILWRTLNHRTRKALTAYDSYTTAIQAKNMLKSGKHKLQDHNAYYANKSVVDAIEVVEGLSSLLHRLIVSTEYCVKCNCKYFSKRARSSHIPISKFGTKIRQ